MNTQAFEKTKAALTSGTGVTIGLGTICTLALSVSLWLVCRIEACEERTASVEQGQAVIRAERRADQVRADERNQQLREDLRDLRDAIMGLQAEIRGMRHGQ